MCGKGREDATWMLCPACGSVLLRQRTVDMSLSKRHSCVQPVRLGEQSKRQESSPHPLTSSLLLPGRNDACDQLAEE